MLVCPFIRKGLRKEGVWINGGKGKLIVLQAPNRPYEILKYIYHLVLKRLISRRVDTDEGLIG